MLEDDFYCTIKFKGGDEIFAKVAAEVEEDRTMLLVSNPIVVEEVKLRGTVVGHKFEPWLKSTTEDMFLVIVHLQVLFAGIAEVNFLLKELRKTLTQHLFR